MGNLQTANGERQATAAAAFMLRSPGWLSDLFQYLPAVAMLSVGALGGAALAGRGPRILRERKALGGALVAGAALGLAKWQLDRFFTEQPEYALEGKVEGVELRRYRERVVAETTVEGPSWDGALNEGFRRLAGYIFGANDGKRKIAMTTPVNAARSRPEKIAMTTPVTGSTQADAVTVTFSMPKDRELASFPTPLDGRVRLRVQPAGRVAALRSYGRYDDRRIAQLQGELLERLRRAGLQPTGPALFAGYDPPSTLPFLRRLEVWAPIA
jgi:hypothetical protein